jgi:two-component sensor histidine kinase
LHKKADNQAWLSIADDGVGLPAGLDIYNSPSLGLQLVHALVGQLGGNLKIKQTDGVQFNIAFPLIKDVPA